MTTVKLKIKINNSYESEPSSGSGSSGEFENSKRNVTYSIVNTENEDLNESPLETSNDSRYNSSRESDFKGFTDYQIKERTISMNKKYSKQKACTNKVEQNQNAISAIGHQSRTSCFYDEIMIEQNSCNAVDMQLMNRNYYGNLDKKKTIPEALGTELSFNGKIKSMTETPIEIICHEEASFKQPKMINPVFEAGDSSFLKYSNDRSPDLFEDDDTDKVEEDNIIYENEERLTEDINKSLNCPTESSFAEENVENVRDEKANMLRQNIKREKELLKRIKTCLSGIPPPPSLTIPQLDMFSAITNNRDEILNFKAEVETIASVIVCEEDGLFKPTHPLDEVLEMPWKDTLGVRGHGLSYNLCKASESIELLSLAVIERFIGAETTTSYTSKQSSSPSSAKKRNLRQKMLTQTTGNNRLSHLAKRRAAFSSANLATNLVKSQSCFLGGMQILLDKKKGKSRRKGTTPKRMTPSSKKKHARKTPSSSARKRLVFRFDTAKSGPSRETSKRALFQSPAKQQRTQAATLKLSLKPEIANRVEKSKRALFSPDKPTEEPSNLTELSSLSQASQSSIFGGNLDFLSLKRKRTEDDEEPKQASKKIFRDEADILTPRSLKIKSQSFCIGTGSTNAMGASKSTMRINHNNNTSTITSSKSSIGRPITKAFSETAFHSTNLLTENHRKKLLWAVSQALQSKQINVAHANFKQFASVLARVVKRIFQEYFLKANTSTSDTMLRLAKKYVCNVVSGKSADEIYMYAKSKIEEERKMSSTRLSGYIAPDEFETRKLVLNQSSLCSFENSMDSFALSQTSSLSMSQPAHNIKNVDDMLIKSKSAIRLAVQPNASLQKSSSKNNLDGLALRENVDCEQRWSDQKKFTGVDQQNVSPYANTSVRSNSQTLSFRSSLYDLNASTAKAKRQISFDSL